MRYGAPLWVFTGQAASTAPPSGEPRRDDFVLPRIMHRAFSGSECDAIRAEAMDMRPARPAFLDGIGDARQSESRWLLPGGGWDWLYMRVSELFLEVNAQFQFDISHFVDPLLVASYPVGNGFGWHLDTATSVTATRKISMTIPLSTAVEYEGGDLEISPFLREAGRRVKGDATMFPSFLCHRVTPITSGHRISLVAWAHGPAFR